MISMEHATAMTCHTCVKLILWGQQRIAVDFFVIFPTSSRLKLASLIASSESNFLIVYPSSVLLLIYKSFKDFEAAAAFPHRPHIHKLPVIFFSYAVIILKLIRFLKSVSIFFFIFAAFSFRLELFKLLNNLILISKLVGGRWFILKSMFLLRLHTSAQDTFPF